MFYSYRYLPYYSKTDIGFVRREVYKTNLTSTLQLPYKIVRFAGTVRAGESASQARKTDAGRALLTPEGRKLWIVQRIAEFDLDLLGCADLSRVVLAPEGAGRTARNGREERAGKGE